MPELLDAYPALGLKNRIVMAPMTRYQCSSEGLPSQELLDYYTRRAENDVGLIIVESAAVNGTDAMGYKNGLQFFSKMHADAWAPALQKVHESSGKIWLQLFHAGRLTVPEIAQGDSIAPSAVAPQKGVSYWRPEVDRKIVHFQTGTEFVVPTEITKSKIESVIGEFARSCELAKQAGFDGVELHGAHGYLIHEFAQKNANLRDDEFRAQDFEFIRRLVTACRDAVGKDFTLAYRLSLHTVDNTFVRYDPEDLDFRGLVDRLEGWGVDVLHSSELRVGYPMFGGDAGLHELIREVTNLPLIACGDALVKGVDLLRENRFDLLAIGRSFISNPDLCSILASGDCSRIVKFDYKSHIEKVV